MSTEAWGSNARLGDFVLVLDWKGECCPNHNLSDCLTVFLESHGKTLCLVRQLSLRQGGNQPGMDTVKSGSDCGQEDDGCTRKGDATRSISLARNVWILVFVRGRLTADGPSV